MGKRQQVATRATIGRNEKRRIAIGTRRLARRKTGRPTICANPGGPWERGIRTLGAERELSWPGTCERAVILERVLVYLYVRVHRWILYQCIDLKCSCQHLIPLARLQQKSWKIISQLISLTFSLSADPNMTHLLQREHPKF